MMKSPNLFDTTIWVISNKILRFRYILVAFSKYMNFSDINQWIRNVELRNVTVRVILWISRYTKNIQTGENL